ncbi:MAG: hypothetical protein JWQ21_3425, partial [Herminiimonas sp.]|nr:hypothetical protein [Herminiimonas sp.]
MHRSRLNFSITLSALLTLLLGLAATVVLFAWAHRQEQSVEDADFERRANFRVSAVKQGLDDTIQALRVVNEAFKTFGPLTREQFHAFTRPLLARFPYIQAFTFHRIISNAERAAFEARKRVHHPGFSITEMINDQPVRAGVRNSYRVVDYLEPMAGNEATFGLDASSMDFQEDTVRRAGKTGLASATRLFQLAVEAGPQRGFLILMPVYRYGAAPDTVASRREAIIGYTVVVLRAGDLVEKILMAAELLNVPGVDISVYGSALPDERELAFRKGSLPAVSNRASIFPEWIFHDRPNNFSQTVDFAGTHWHMVASAQPTSFTFAHIGSLLVLLVGISVSFMAAVYVQTLTSRTRRIQGLVDERTAELRLANETLTEDIAARMKAEKTLRHTQHILTSAQKFAHLGSWELDATTGELQCSDEFFRICGLEPQSIKPSLEFLIGIVHPHDLETAQKAIAAKTEGIDYKIEKRIVRPDGSVRHVITQGEAILDEKRELIKVVGSFLDVTEHKQTETELRESKEELRRLAARQESIREDERKRIAREVHDELGG